MSEKRKLQNDIDRTLRKVEEGISLIDTLWDRLETVGSALQEDKIHCEIKKETKKLQRLRDNIKSWISQGDYRDKDTLKRSRRIIEERMERFKGLEKEAKTKAYSKEGLQQAARKSKISEPKDQCLEYLQTIKRDLEDLIENAETEIDDLMASLSKTKKKRIQQQISESIITFEGHIESHRFHLQKIEELYRSVFNDQLDPEEVIEIVQPQLEYYVDFYNTDDFFIDTNFYDDLQEGSKHYEVNVSLGKDSDFSDVESCGTSEKLTSNDDTATDDSYSVVSKSSTLSHVTNTTQTTNNELEVTSTTSSRNLGFKRLPTMVLSPSPRVESKSLAAILRNANTDRKEDRKPPIAPPPSIIVPSTRSVKDQSSDFRQYDNLIVVEDSAHQNETIQTGQPTPYSKEPTSVHSPSSRVPSCISTSFQPESNSNVKKQLLHKEQFKKDPIRYLKTRIDSTLNESVTIFEHLHYMKYVPQNPWPTPSYYPQIPSSLVLSPNASVLAKFSPELLFYLSFFESAHLQHIANNRLKKNHWRYHTEENAWFLRDSNPETTNAYEKGDYLVVNPEGEEFLRPQKIHDFTFDYEFLEGKGKYA
eukprot:TRINITY_DN2908_c0_g1_i1.p1 TRINITY_DN2908_c0_g1~~TRINITY_DN2908_c0_g1_i1.p1  ORF type:complete len:590 (-),score=141.96 TRINITY_DN2908_c0_g1_i1:19-1788(-)